MSTDHSPDRVSGLEPGAARARFRSGEMVRPTSGMCVGYVQANLAFLPAEYADDFEEMCRLNSQALPLIERLPVGDAVPRACASNADLRTDAAQYMVYDGASWTTVPDLLDVWDADIVSFVIGCSFSAERGLIDGGVTLPHLGRGGGVPIYRTTRTLVPAGDLTGHLVVSMRAIRDAEVTEAARITGRYPLAHGAPVWTGPGADIGCRDGLDPDWGVELPVAENETPVYWACGVTPQTIIEESGVPRAMVHSPGHMFITDIPEHTIIDVSPADWRTRHDL